MYVKLVQLVVLIIVVLTVAPMELALHLLAMDTEIVQYLYVLEDFQLVQHLYVIHGVNVQHLYVTGIINHPVAFVPIIQQHNKQDADHHIFIQYLFVVNILIVIKLDCSV
jgi:hypothetical protein